MVNFTVCAGWWWGARLEACGGGVGGWVCVCVGGGSSAPSPCSWASSCQMRGAFMQLKLLLGPMPLLQLLLWQDHDPAAGCCCSFQ
jgi:hypothetical protein